MMIDSYDEEEDKNNEDNSDSEDDDEYDQQVRILLKYLIFVFQIEL